MIAIYLNKQQALDVDPKPIQQINFNENLDWEENTTMFFIIEEAMETIFRLFTRNSKSTINLFCFNTILI